MGRGGAGPGGAGRGGERRGEAGRGCGRMGSPTLSTDLFSPSKLSNVVLFRRGGHATYAPVALQLCRFSRSSIAVAGGGRPAGSRATAGRSAHALGPRAMTRARRTTQSGAWPLDGTGGEGGGKGGSRPLAAPGAPQGGTGGSSSHALGACHRRSCAQLRNSWLWSQRHRSMRQPCGWRHCAT